MPSEDGQLTEICKGHKYLQTESYWMALTIIQQKSLPHTHIASQLLQRLTSFNTQKQNIYINCMETATKLSECLIICINTAEDNKSVSYRQV
jgi:hypothetical protein